MTEQPHLGRFWDPESFHRARMETLSRLGITVFVDGGANTGEYASHIRHSGYAGKIVSFEPSSVEFARLYELAAHDPDWECHRLALGDEDRIAHFHLAANSESSSLLPMLDRHLASAPESAYHGVEIVNVRRLDSVCSEFASGAERVYLKLDLQGFEKAALAGASRLLESTAAIEIELALVRLYEGQAVAEEMIAELRRLGFVMLGYEHNFVDPVTGEVLEVNGIGVRDATTSA